MNAEEIEKIRRFQIIAKQRVLDLFYGAYRSAFKGSGIEVEDIREYIAGDDIRAMSWAKTAAMGKPYVKTFREERDLIVTLVVDISASLLFGSRFSTKRESLAHIGALLAFSAIFNHDKVSLLLFSDKVERYISPKRGNKHGVRLVRELLSYTPIGKKTDIAGALHFLQTVQKKRSIVFLLSDFLADSWDKPFMLLSKKDDLIAIRIQDPAEQAFPAVGLARVCNMENEEEMIIDLNRETAAKMKEEAAERSRHFHDIVGSSGASCIDIQTDASYDAVVLAFFKKRKRELVR